MNLTTPLHLAPRLGIIGEILLRLPICLQDVEKNILTFVSLLVYIGC